MSKVYILLELDGKQDEAPRRAEGTLKNQNGLVRAVEPPLSSSHPFYIHY